MTIEEHVLQMLLLGRRLIAEHPALTAETGAVNVKGDHTIQMDVKTESAMIDYIKENNIPASIFSEEIGLVAYHQHPEYLIAFDPLDGSTNYKLGKNLYPYGFMVAVYEGVSPRLNDVVAAGAVEYSQGLGWIFHDGKTETLDGKKVIIKNDWTIDRHLPVYLDLYYKNAYELYRPLPEKIFIRNVGSTIGNLSFLLENTAAAMGHVCMRPEEVGAAVALITGAGGVVRDHEGKNVGDKLFSTEEKYQIVAGGQKIIDFLLQQLAK